MAAFGNDLQLRGVPPHLRVAILASVLNDASRAVVLLDAEGRFSFANELLCEAYGVPVSRHLGQPAREIAPVLWQSLGPIFERVREGAVVEFERPLGRLEEAPGLWLERWTAIRGGDDGTGDNEVVAILGTSRPIARNATNAPDPERLVERRERLIEVASHELRGPLSSVLGFARRLNSLEGLPPQAAEAIQLIREQAQEMAFRLEMFLGASEADRPPSGFDDPGFEEVDLADLLRREIEALEARRPGVSTDFDCPPSLIVQTNPHYVRQIFGNLLDNAARYGSGWVGLKAELDEDSILIRVEDDGDGISPEEQPLVFARGYRAASARRSTPGQGLGLFVARELAQRLQATLTVRSTVSVGTTFALRLPCTAAAAVRPPVFFA